MLERNFLSHARLGLFLLLLSSSVLLKARLPGPDRPKDREEHPYYGLGIPLATVQVLAALIVIGAGCWAYESGIRDMHARRAFLISSDPQFVIMVIIAAVVSIICIILLASEGEIG